MNYLAQGILQGGQIGAELVRDAKRRKFESEMRARDLAAELDRQARGFAAQKDLQNARQVFEAEQGFKNRDWQSTENQRGRDFSSSEADKSRLFTGTENQRGRDFSAGEADKTRAFQGSQSELDRAARALALDRELAARATLAGAENTFREKQLGWTTSEQNPQNQYYRALAKGMEVPDFGTGGQPRLSEVDQQALEWAKANPNDPRSAAILKKLSGQ